MIYLYIRGIINSDPSSATKGESTDNFIAPRRGVI